MIRSFLFAKSMEVLQMITTNDGARFSTQWGPKKKNLEVKGGQKKILTQIICIYIYLFKLH